MRHLLLIALAAASLAVQPAVAHQRASASMNCPSAAQQSRVRHIHDRIGALQARLNQLDSRLDDFDSARRDALDDAKRRIEAAARNSSLSPAEIDREVAHVIADADARAKSVARSASAVQAEKASVNGKMQSLEQQLHTLARQEAGLPDDG